MNSNNISTLHIQILTGIYNDFHEWSPSDVVANVLDCDIMAREFEL